MELLQRIVQCLARPIDFASHNAAARRSPVIKDLGAFVTRQVLEALAQKVFAPVVETDLLALQQLFSDYHERLPIEERTRRLDDAREILKRLREYQGTGRGARGTRQDDRSQTSGSESRVPSTDGSQTDSQLKTHNSKLSPDRRPVPASDALWSIPIRYAKGVGPKRAALFERLGIRTVEDCVWYLPWRYEDRSVVTAISELRLGARATICGTILEAKLKRTARRGMTILEAKVGDNSGWLTCVYFNQPYMEKLLQPGARVMLSGTVSAGRRGWTALQMDAPHYEVLGDEAETPLHIGRIVPIYHETRGLSSRQIRTVIKGLLDEYVGNLEELIPGETLGRQGLPTLKEAIGKVHFPPEHTALDSLERGSTVSRQRLAFEEFFVLELALAFRQRTVKEEVKGIRFDVNTPLLRRLQHHLPFSLTSAQQRVLSEIAMDMGASRSMNRLLQGDVGCGKTIVALHAMVTSCGSGYQAALMVPTEILAEQHFLNMRDLLSSLGLKTVLLKSGGGQKERTALMQQIESGEAKVVIGTHALIQKDVRFDRLGLAVVDEQHKFGVLQRKTLLEKGYRPDVLVLTATPIPRTLAMTVYGDLDVSVIDALPPGRKPVKTLLFGESQRRRAYQMVHDEIRAGRQAYIVYPLVEESEKMDLQAALQGAERLQTDVFRAYRVGVLHGRMKTDEKDRTMAAFKAGTIHVLVATTVVEVGVDVPNATVMLVEHAERFGLAQLHQLRGRVGRGGEQSYCLLLMSGRNVSRVSGKEVSGKGVFQTAFPADPSPVYPSPRISTARQRLEALVQSNDGFVIADEDLRIRGPGEFFGVRQWGVPEFRAASLIRDAAILERARQEAFALLKSDPRLAEPAHQGLRRTMVRRWGQKLDLGTVS